MFATVQRLLEVLGRCPKCGRIPIRAWYSGRTRIRTGYSGGKKKVTLHTIQDRDLAGRIAKVVHKNSENKDGILVENYPGDLNLTKAFIQAGFSKVIVTVPEQDNTISEAIPEKVEVQQGNVFYNLIQVSKVEDIIYDRLPHRFWPDAPVVSVFGILPDKEMADQKLFYLLIRKLCYLSGFYAAGRVEWFLFVTPAKARALLCGSGEGPKKYYCASRAVLNVLYDIKHCLTVSANDFVPRFRTGPFSYQIPVYIKDVLLTDDKVYLLKLVPRRDLHIGIPTQDIWPFYLFMKQVLAKKNERIIPVMEKFIHGCGLKMIDMGFTMVHEVWQIKPAEYLDLYMNAITWPEFQDSFMQTYLKGKLMNMLMDVTEDPVHTENHVYTDITDHISSDITQEHVIMDITPEHIDTDITEEHLNADITEHITSKHIDTDITEDYLYVDITEHRDTDIKPEEIDLDTTDEHFAPDVIKQKIDADIT